MTASQYRGESCGTQAALASMQYLSCLSSAVSLFTVLQA